jgi:hypothetical protein
MRHVVYEGKSREETIGWTREHSGLVPKGFELFAHEHGRFEPREEARSGAQTGGTQAMSERKNFWRAFLDFFVLFSGVSTASNLSRTRKAPVVGRGLFLFRKGPRARPAASSDPKH